MARPRNYKAETARRNELARQRGAKSYYEKRVAGVPKGERAQARGHRSSRDLVRDLKEGDLILCDITGVKYGTSRRTVKVTTYKPDRRFKTGRRPVVTSRRVTVEVFDLIEKTVIPATLGQHRDYTLRRLTREELRELIDEEIAKGAIFSPNPSQDQRRLDADFR